MLKKLLIVAIFSIVCPSLVIAEEKPAQPDLMFWSRMTMGNIVSATEQSSGYDFEFEGEWLESFDAGVRMTRTLSPNLMGRLNMGVGINAATVAQKGVTMTKETAAKRLVPILLDATMQYKQEGLFLGDDSLLLEFGYFPFKYNPQSTSLGEYIFRSGTYPGWLVSGFEHSIDRPKLAGVHVGHTFGSDIRIKQDLIINTELEVFPYRDINLAYIVTPSIGRVFDCGFGVEFARLITPDPQKTTIGLDSLFKNTYDTRVGYIDTVSGDTILYTFKGTKLMGRATLDVKEFFGETADFFGKEDLKLYGEAIILGVKDYAGWYDNILERIPVTVGMNWPTHQLLSYGIIPGALGYLLEQKPSEKWATASGFGGGGIILGLGLWALDHFLGYNTKLDILSIEGEYNPSPYANAQDNIWKNVSPVPYVPDRLIPNYDVYWNDSMSLTNDDFKWSVYASKKIGKYFRLSAQVASDHTPKIWHTPWPAPQSVKYNDMVPLTKNWYFMMRASMYF